MSLRLTGYPEQAARRQRELEDLVDALANPACTGVGLGVGMYYYYDIHDLDAVARKAEEGYALSIDAGFAFWSATMRVYRGWVQALSGDNKGGIAELKSGIDSFVGTQSGIYVPTMWLMLAETLRADGRAHAALEAIATSLRLVEQFDERYYEAEVYRMRGEIEIDVGDRAAGEASLRRAIEVARRQQAKLLELRAAVVLARLLSNTGRSEEARELLRPLDAWFTEGRDEPEMIAMRSLLAALGDSGVSTPAHAVDAHYR